MSDAPDPWADLADDIRRARDADPARAALVDARQQARTERSEIWQARATQAEARVAELEAEAKALADDRGKLMLALTARTGETMRLREACETALCNLRHDLPQTAAAVLRAALALLEETTRA